MSDIFGSFPQLPGTPIEKLTNARNYERIEQHIQSMLSEQPTKQEILRAFRYYDEQLGVYFDRHSRTLEQWANSHRHRGLIGDDGEFWTPEEGSIPGVNPTIPRVHVNVGGKVYSWNFGAGEWVEVEDLSSTTLTGVAWFEGIDYASSRLIRLGNNVSPNGGDYWAPGNSNWTSFPTGAPSGSSTRLAGVTWHDGKVWLVGGKGSGTTSSYNHVRSVVPWESDSWISYASHPVNIEQQAIVWHEGLLHSIGGREANTNTTYFTHRVYDPSLDSWDSLPDIPASFVLCPCTSLAGAIYILRKETPRTLYRWTSGGGWESMGTVPGEIEQPFTFLGDALANRGYLLGGWFNDSSTQFWIYNPGDNTWEEGPALPAASTITAAGLIGQ